MSDRISSYESGGNTWDDEGEDALDGGDLPEFATEPQRRARVPKISVLLDDPLFTVIDKPPGLPTIPPRDGGVPTAQSQLHDLWRREQVAGGARDAAPPPMPVVCHRLDVETSGCLVFAKSRNVARVLMESFRKRLVHKSYLALALGAPYPESGRIEYRLAPDKRRAGAMQLVRKGGKECAAEYETLEQFRGLSWMRVRPITGRTHEVRLALRSLDTPCAVDPLYGGDAQLLLSRWKRDYRTGRGRKERPLVDRVTLHAESLSFPHPSGDPEDPQTPRVYVEAPLPKDLASTLRQLRLHAEPGSL